MNNEVKIVELVVPKKNKLYMIAYSTDGVVGLDYTSNMAEFFELLRYHDTHSDSYNVYSIANKGAKK